MLREIIGWKILKEFTYRRPLVEVQCGCGEIEIRRKDHVLSGRSKYCKKCASSQTLRDHPNKLFGPRHHQGIGDISKTLWGAIKQGAKVRDIVFEITMQDAWDVYQNQKGLCALSGEPIILKHGYVGCNVNWKEFNASLDRIDSSEGYVVGNIQCIHEDINRMKGCLPESKFLFWCERITQNRKS